jgi:hypothetical protein
MDIEIFRQIVDDAPQGIAACDGDLRRMYDYIGLQQTPTQTIRAVSEELYSRIRECFTSGHSAVWRTCKQLRTDLIRQHVLCGTSLDPYFEVLVHLQDAVRVAAGQQMPIEDDWKSAIRLAFDYVQIQSLGTQNRERIYTRDFMVAKGARALQEAGFAIRIEPGSLRLEEAAEAALVGEIEQLITTMGGINVARRIFNELSPSYYADQQRYHIVRRVSPLGGGVPQIPWGYLVQLAVKHLHGRKPYVDSEAHWQRLCGLAKAYAAIIDVQPYAPNFYLTMDATVLVRYLQEMAVYDTLFCIPQMRPTDVVKLARGIFDWLDRSAPLKAGWSIDQVLTITTYLLDPVRDARGPILIDEVDIQRACPDIPNKVLARILDEVLSHPATGANQRFSRPTDAPTPNVPELKDVGHDFFLRPLLRLSNRRFVLLDRSVCAPAFLEALLTALRQEVKGLDDKIGPTIERFLKAEFAFAGIDVLGGDYDARGEHGQCDLIIEAPDAVILLELKKKSLTRRSKAGSDIALLLDLAGSLLDAQAQAGWHEVRLRRDGHLDLDHEGTTTRLNLNGRNIERLAISLLDFGSFQDRIFLQQFLEATMNAQFTPVDANFTDKFAGINKTLGEIREQIALLHPGELQIKQPFFQCWFLSVPQLLILLDGVTEVSGFKAALWNCRHIATGSSDIYFDMSYMKRLKSTSGSSSGVPATE